ncbi:TcpQ domain-containing protein [uncultured Amphritea sp.]|uniref:TcpQ domain-containing protein n=1 Tax=uncultured Amphritea sp. TaxID=981605 RepID=UPI00261B973A|nr:TcpQ domain-containing protein [uncultured Amphritea sp.]
MKKVAYTFMMAIILSGCVANHKEQVQVQVQTEQAQYESVVSVDEYMFEMQPGSVESALQQLADNAGLKLRYEAETFFHNIRGNVRGSTSVIAKQFTQNFPLRFYVLGNELVVEQHWRIVPGKKIQDQLYEWDAASLWHVVWDTRKNQDVLAGADFYGTFDHAVEALFRALRNSGSELDPEFYANKVVVVR